MMINNNNNKSLIFRGITFLSYTISLVDCLQKSFPTIINVKTYPSHHPFHQNHSQFSSVDGLAKYPVPSFFAIHYDSINHRIRRHEDENVIENVDEEYEEEGNEEAETEDKEEEDNPVDGDRETESMDESIQNEEWTKLKDNLRKQLDQEDENDQIELLRIARKSDPTFYYRKPGEECLTDGFIKSETLRLNKTGNITQYQLHILERKRCFFYTKTYCAKVEPRSQAKFAKDGKHHVEYRCICIPGRTWEDGGCSSYHDQYCSWDSDCVQNAICLFEDDRKWIADAKAEIAAKRETKKKEREKKLQKLNSGTDDKEVNVEEEDIDDDYEESNDEQQQKRKTMGKKFSKLLQKERKERGIEFIPSHKQDDGDSQPKKDKSKKSDSGSSAGKHEMEHKGLQTRRLHKEGGAILRKVHERIRNFVKFLVGKCMCDPFRKCQRTSKLPPFVETAGAKNLTLNTFFFALFFFKNIMLHLLLFFLNNLFG